VWKLETASEDVASEELNRVITMALKGHQPAIQCLLKVWRGDTWQTIKERVQVEGSCWYVWYMDGVHNLMCQNEQQVSRRETLPIWIT